MTRLFFLISLIAIATFSAAKAGTIHETKDLQLTAEIIRQRYCTGDADLDGVSLDLKLLYRNTGTSPLILYKGSTNVSEIVVRKTPDGPPELDSSLHWYYDKPWKVGAFSLRKIFVILQPGGTFEAHTEVRVFVTRDDSRHFQGAVESGDHYLEITIPTWQGSRESADTMQRKWRSSGILWHTPATSLPLKFTITKQRTVTDC